LEALSPGAFSYFLAVLDGSPVSFATALLKSAPRSFMRLTLPIMSMASPSCLLLNNSAIQWNTLVDF